MGLAVLFCRDGGLKLMPNAPQGLQNEVVLWYNAGVDVCHSLYG